MSAAPFATGELPSRTVLAFSLNFYWDAGGLEWVEGTQPGGSGGGAVTIADGSDVAEGATTDAAVVTDAAGTLSGKLRGLVKWAFERMPASLGQKTMAASLPVVVASDQSAVPISGTVTANTGLSQPLTDAQLRATPVPVSNTNLDVALSTRLSESDFDTKTGGLTESAPGTDTASSGLNGRLQRIAQRITSLISALGSPFQAGGSIGNTAFGVNNAAGASAVNIQDGGNTITVDGSVGVSGSVAVTGPLTDTQLRATPVPVSGTVTANPTGYVVRLEEASATITYVGQAAPGTLTSAASWSIKRLDSTSGLVVLWGGGTAAFNQIWDNRAALAYS